MNHKVENIDYKHLPEGQFAVLAQCCGTDHISWHTMAASVVLDDAKLQSSMDWFHQRVANEHEAAIQAEAELKKLVGTSKHVDLAAAPTAP